MEHLEKLTELISEFIKKAQREDLYYEEIYSKPDLVHGKNEFMFFIKPEITASSETIHLDKILDFILTQIAKFGFNIHNIKVLSAQYLEKYNIIAQHYGVIDKIAFDAIHNMSQSAKEKFKELYGKSINDVSVLGGAEFLEKYPFFNAYSLDCLWQNLELKKLAGGTYSEVFKVDKEVMYVLNGFHPIQLKHFTEKGRSIVVMTLSSDISWKEARSNFIGATDPNKANPGTLRRTFLDRKVEFGLDEVGQSYNGVHLSAGPVEALVELRRFNSDFSVENGEKDFSEFSFGKELLKAFNGKIGKITDNANVVHLGEEISVFDLTEEMDSDVAIELLKKVVISD